MWETEIKVRPAKLDIIRDKIYVLGKQYDYSISTQKLSDKRLMVKVFNINSSHPKLGEFEDALSELITSS